MNRLSVTELNNQIKSLLEATFLNIYVTGEISNLTYHKSGHIYFNLKDEQSAIKVVLFRGNAKYLKFRLEEGQKVNIFGSVSVYTPRGDYQIICSKVEPAGVGELAKAYEQLKTKLQIEGLFDKAYKKPLPKFPRNIFVITSNSGAAIEDMKKILSHRYPLAKMILLPTLVQGEMAKYDIVKNIKKSDKLAKKQDIIIVGRGGGSLEDIWAFNEEIVARAIFEANTPIISAVGHESDFVISDFVADIRASTPSNAIEIATPDVSELLIYIDNLAQNFNHNINNTLNLKSQYLNGLKTIFKSNSIKTKITNIIEQIKNFQFGFNNSYLHILKTKQIEMLNINYKNSLKYILTYKINNLNSIKDSFELSNPNKIKNIKGFVQTTKNGKIFNIDKVNIGENITIESLKFKFLVKILDKQKII